MMTTTTGPGLKWARLVCAISDRLDRHAIMTIDASAKDQSYYHRYRVNIPRFVDTSTGASCRRSSWRLCVDVMSSTGSGWAGETEYIDCCEARGKSESDKERVKPLYESNEALLLIADC